MRGTPCTSRVCTVMVEVMPGRSFWSGFSTATTAGYVTTPDTLFALYRICDTTPWNVSPGKASTTQSAAMPSAILPTSASSTSASTRILCRSSAITKSTGAWKLATTVAPGSIPRVTTMPSTGA
jgi:hypothetical protein